METKAIPLGRINPKMIPMRSLPLVGVSLWISALAMQSAVAQRWEAYTGEPFGVGSVTLRVDRDRPSMPLGDERFMVAEAGGRVLYPVLQQAPVRRLFRQLLEIDTPANVTIYFLFQGDGPFELQAFAPSEQLVTVTPQRNPQAYQRLLDQWWNEYSGRWKRLQQNPEFPPVVENYLAATLARRLGKEMPEAPGGLLLGRAKKATAAEELFAGEAFLLRLDRQLLRSPSESDSLPPAPEPLPSPMAWSPPSFPAEGLDDVPVEAIAAHVPEECFYLRFGTFKNYLWFRDLKKKWQGDLQNMIQRRGIDSQAPKRIEQQLSLRESALAKILGPQVIDDVAIIGLDTNLNQGPAIGILFQAKNNFLLAQDLNSKRREALDKFSDATETTVTIAEHEVSLIATPDGKVRSYYAVDGDYHLVATSRSLVERFYRAGGGERSLAISDGLRYARLKLPLERNDAMFAYASSAFFQQLCSPAVRIECLRRMESARELKLLELARMAAVAEGVVDSEKAKQTGRDELIRAGLLPEGFGLRADDSRLVEDAEGGVDSLRGRLGYFLPVADSPEVTEATAEEVAAYRQFSARFRDEIGSLPPLAAGLQRESHDGVETMIADVHLLYTTGMKLSRWTKHLGQPSDEQVAAVEGDVASFEAVLDVPVPLIGGEKQAHHLFGALRDFRSPLVVQRGAVVPGAPPAELIRGYLGAWPIPGVLELLGGSALVDQPEPQPLGDEAWQAGRDEFLLLSFKQDVIEQVLPQLAIVPAVRPAQVRFAVSDLTGTQLSETVSALGYKRARETCVAASRLMNTLAGQLHVPRSECRDVAERLVDGRFVCPLGGEYQLYQPPRGLPVWVSTALPESNRFLLTAVPDDFELPILTWFRGLRGDMEVAGRETCFHVEVDMAPIAIPE